jgi:hypothetical protein
VLRSYTIDDDLGAADRAAVEVTVTLTDVRRRWCFFITPAALAAVGDYVEGTSVRVHLGEPHMIVVSEVSRDVVERVLRQLDADGELVRRTQPLASSGRRDVAAG